MLRFVSQLKQPFLAGVNAVNTTESLKIADSAAYNAEIPSAQCETEAINMKTPSLGQVTVNLTGVLKR